MTIPHPDLAIVKWAKSPTSSAYTFRGVAMKPEQLEAFLGSQTEEHLVALWTATRDHNRQDGGATVTQKVGHWVRNDLAQWIGVECPNGTNLEDTGTYYIHKPLGPLEGWERGALIRHHELENALTIHVPNLANEWGDVDPNSGEFKPMKGITPTLVIGHLQNVISQKRSTRIADLQDSMRFAGGEEHPEDRVPPLVGQFVKQILRGRLKLNAEPHHLRNHAVMLWQWLWQVKRATFGYLTELESSDRIMLVLYSKAGLIGKDVLINLLTSGFVRAGVRADVRTQILTDSWAAGTLGKNFICNWSELNFGKDPSAHIDNFKSLVTSYKWNQRQMRSENTVSPVLFPSHIGSANRPISEVFDNPDDAGLARRLWQMELLVTKADEAELRAEFGEFESFPFGELWKGIDETNPNPPMKRFGTEFLAALIDSQIKTLCPSPMAEVLDGYGLRAVEGNGLTVIKLPALTRLIHDGFLQNHAISDRTPERVTRDAILRAIGPMGINRGYYLEGGSKVDLLVVDQVLVRSKGQVTTPTYCHSGTYWVDGSPVALTAEYPK